MRRLVVGCAVVALAAGCGGSKRSEVPTTALLTDVTVGAQSVRFDFRSQPMHVRARYEAQVSECGSGAPVPLRGAASVVVHFTPAASADLRGEHVVPTYTGPRRIAGQGPVLEAVKMCDFESDLGWAIGLERRLPLHVSRDGDVVTVSVG
jgi:hypothetical protein